MHCQFFREKSVVAVHTDRPSQSVTHQTLNAPHSEILNTQISQKKRRERLKSALYLRLKKRKKFFFKKNFEYFFFQK